MSFIGSRAVPEGDSPIENSLIGSKYYFTKKNASGLSNLIFKLLLRTSTKIDGVESTIVYRNAVRILGAVYFSVFYRKVMDVSLSKGIGYFPIPVTSRSQLMIGYFQSYKYLETLDKDEFYAMLSPKCPSVHFLEESLRLEGSNQIVVHVRLGDYLNEPLIGIPSTKYYESALNKVRTIYKSNQILIFSDEPLHALKFMPDNFIDQAQIVDESKFTLIENFNLMRLGCAYVLANSTFGWWAARSATSSPQAVICPEPWFAGLPTPNDLIPREWLSFPPKISEANMIEPWPPIE